MRPVLRLESEVPQSEHPLGATKSPTLYAIAMLVQRPIEGEQVGCFGVPERLDGLSGSPAPVVLFATRVGQDDAPAPGLQTADTFLSCDWGETYLA